jgi:cobaltochelatase CobT
MASDHGAYRVFTRRFDREVTAKDLDRDFARGGSIGAARLDAAWETFVAGTLNWRTAAEIRALEASQRIRAAVPATVLSDTVVSLLADQSGSMRGQKLLLAAAALDVARSFLAGLGVKVEILGFTTRTWRGGRPRWLWRLKGRPRNPGRLCERLHLVYVQTDTVASGSGQRALAHMFAPDLLKENLDGEALEWAAERLLARPETRRLVVMLSDGAPVDDATLQANGATYLWDHLLATIARYAPKLQLAQLQIGDDFESPFPTHAIAQAPDDLAGALIDLLEAMLTETAEAASAT